MYSFLIPLVTFVCHQLFFPCHIPDHQFCNAVVLRVCAYQLSCQRGIKARVRFQHADIKGFAVTRRGRGEESPTGVMSSYLTKLSKGKMRWAAGLELNEAQNCLHRGAIRGADTHMVQAYNSGWIDQNIAAALVGIAFRFPQFQPVRQPLCIRPPRGGSPDIPEGGGEHSITPIGFAGGIHQERPG